MRTTNQITLPDGRLLSTALSSHAAWLRGEPGHRANLRGANLYGADLRRVDLRGAIFSEANLSAADLRGANLYGAGLRWADLRGANLSGVDLREANLYGVNLYGAGLRWADLRWADLREAGLRWADLREADLSGADLYETDLYRADLRGANGLPDLAVPGLASRVLEQIEAHPESLEMAAWHSACGTKHCAAGWCVVLGGEAVVDAERVYGTANAAWLALGRPSETKFGADDDPLPWLRELASAD